MGRGCFIGVEGMLLALDTVTTKEGINGGLLATEALIELLGITAVTLTQDLTTEALSCSRSSQLHSHLRRCVRRRCSSGKVQV